MAAVASLHLTAPSIIYRPVIRLSLVIVICIVGNVFSGH